MPGTKPKVDGAEIQQPKEQTKKKEKRKKKLLLEKIYELYRPLQVLCTKNM